jgi:hypothetical protein
MFGPSNLPEKLKHRLREDTVGELTIRLLRYNYCETPENPYLERILATGKKAYFVVCSHTSTVLGLKQRLSGLSEVPSHLLVLYYLGKVMVDDDFVPKEAFEFLSYEDSDDDVFKARIYMEITFDPDDPEAPETNHQRHQREARERIEAEARVLQLRQEERERKEAALAEEAEKMVAFEAKIRKKEARHHFDLKGELTKIGCETFYEAMLKAGFQDEGAFATVTEEILAGEGLWIPRLSRIRILSLRDAFARKHDLKQRAAHGSIKAEVAGLGRERVDANGKHFKTKKEMEDHWKKTRAEEEARLKRLRDGIQPKPHSQALKDKIAKIRIDEARDEDGMLIKDSHRLIYLPAKFCCKPHQIVSTRNRETFLDVRQRGNMAEFEVAIDHADVYKNGYLSREVLQLLARIQCDKLLRGPSNRIEPEHEKFTIARVRAEGPSDRSPEASPMRRVNPRAELSKIEEAERREEKWKSEKAAAYASIDKALDKSLMSAHAQEYHVNWSGPKEMQANIGGFPSERYDVALFVLKMKALFRAIDHDHYMEESKF